MAFRGLMVTEIRDDPVKIVLHADDLGLSLSFNEGVLASATHGLLTSTCIRVNGTAYRDAIDRVMPSMPHVAVGLHLNIVEGRSTRKHIGANETLCAPDGTYRLGFLSLLRHSKKPSFLAEVDADFRDQIERARKDLAIDHLNSHQHSHAIPAIFELTCRLAVEYGIPFVRLPRERPYAAGPFWHHLRKWYALNFIKSIILNAMAIRNAWTAARYGVQTPHAFVGILYTGNMTVSTTIAGIRRAAQPGALIEVLFHPARLLGRRDEVFLDAVNVRDYVFDLARRQEMSALTSSALRGAIADRGWQLATMRGVECTPPAATTIVDNSDRRLRTVAVLDETPFYQPSYFQRRRQECRDIEVAAVAVVILPNGGKLQSYLVKHWRELGALQLIRLGLKSGMLRALDQLPRFIRGDFTSSVRRLAREASLPYCIVNKVNTDEFRDWVRSFSPDLIISSNSCIFGPELIAIPKVGCINRHSALLPAYGGILPVFRAVQFGESHTGVSVHHMVERVDEGPVLSRKYVPIFPGDTLDRLYRLCFIASYDATVDAIRQLKLNAPPIGNDGIKPSYFSYPLPEDWQLFCKRGIPFI